MIIFKVNFVCRSVSYELTSAFVQYVASEVVVFVVVHFVVKVVIVTCGGNSFLLPCVGSLRIR